MPIQGVSPRLLEIGRIRMGEKGSKGEPKRLEHWRLTSAHLDSLNAAAKLYGGTVGEWEQGYELLTEADVLTVLVPPNAFTSYLEAWTAGGIQRRCDGLTELITGDECQCSTNGNQVCEPASNLRVLMPTLPGIGVWRLATKGWTAAAELQGTIDLLSKIAHAGEYPAAELVLDQRSKVVAGQTRRYSVPVLRLPYSLAELGETRSLHQGTVVARVDTHTGEINPVSSPEAHSREGRAGTGETPAELSSSSAGEQSAQRAESPTTSAGVAVGDGGDGLDNASSVPPKSSGRGKAGSRGRGSAPSSGVSGAGETSLPPAGSPAPDSACKHLNGVTVDNACIDCGAKMKVSA